MLLVQLKIKNTMDESYEVLFMRRMLVGMKDERNRFVLTLTVRNLRPDGRVLNLHASTCSLSVWIFSAFLRVRSLYSTSSPSVLRPITLSAVVVILRRWFLSCTVRDPYQQTKLKHKTLCINVL